MNIKVVVSGTWKDWVGEMVGEVMQLCKNLKTVKERNIIRFSNLENSMDWSYMEK